MMVSRCVLILLALSSWVCAQTPVRLQLKWEHEFQFAGYYAAKWQGYYEEAGLDVEIIPASVPDGAIVSPTQVLLDGQAEFAIGAVDILTSYHPKDEFVVLAPIFQHSPIAFYSLPDKPIDSIDDLASLRIALIRGGNVQTEVESMFRARGYELKAIELVEAPVNVQTLIDGLADVIVTYQVSAEYQALEAKLTLNRLVPAEHGIDFYGDTLFTRKQFLAENPQVVSAFRNASLRGWHYALSHKREIAQRISAELPRHLYQYRDQFAYNLFFADKMEQITGFPNVSLGDSSRIRWQHMIDRLDQQGLLEHSIDVNNLLFNPMQVQVQSNKLFLQIILALTLLLFIFYFWYRRNAALTTLSIMALALFLNYQIESQIKREAEQLNRVSVLQKLNNISASLKGNLQTSLSTLRGFAAYISANPNITEAEFSAYAREVMKKDNLINNFAAAKDLVVNLVYPVKGNEKALGLNYRTHPVQRDMALQVAQTGQVLVIGPVNLVQGGRAFIGRAPIYTGRDHERELWGIISAPIDADKLLRSSGINPEFLDLELAIRSFDSLGNLESVILGQPEIFEQSDAELITLSVGGGSWQLAARSKGSAASFNTALWFTRIIILLTTIIILYYVRVRFKQEMERNELQRELINSQKLLEKVGRTAKVGGWRMNAAQTIIQWSPQTSRILEIQERQFEIKHFAEIQDKFSDESYEQLMASIAYALDFQQSFDIDLKLSQKHRWVRVIGSPSFENGELILIGTMQDVSDKIESSLLIEHQANYDSLTNLPNRSLFNDRLTQAVEVAAGHDKKVVVLFIDLDRFKPVNDNFGHDVGDQLLIEVANDIKSCVSQAATVSRISGDEFGVILPNVEDFNEALTSVETILGKLDTSHSIKGTTMYTSASIGISIFPNDGRDAKTLLRKADQAMYEVKRSGRNGWQFYTLEMQQRSEFRHSLLTQLIDAINQNQLETYYQPIFQLSNMAIDKCEALARWRNHDNTFISPADFIPLAEESGLVNRIDLQMFQNAEKVLTELQTDNHDIGLSINISPRLFQTKDHALEQWLELVEKANERIKITVEMTERLLTQDSARAVNVLQMLKEQKVNIAIDDFGTGYSSLSYLVKFPVDVIKIDRSFVDKIGSDPSAETLVKTILVMAKKLSLKVIAEGIETAEQLEFLRTHGCEYGQGFYLAKPMSQYDFVAMVHEHAGSLSL
ncbi:MAG: EAL domain-containing protein [Gammaproteobacteria bacterium]|nr:EAL domain-containing protein [Gammaproteobacteria bacterium]